MIKNINLRGKGIIGYINYETKQFMTIRTREHFFHKFNGFGLSFSVIDLLEKEGIEEVVIEYEGKFYKTTITKFSIHGDIWDDNGDKQLILNLKHFINTRIISIQTKL